jgi:hypothetical protein
VILEHLRRIHLAVGFLTLLLPDPRAGEKRSGVVFSIGHAF